ncbi:MAG TPA: ABC transporter ATP-binding protein [Thermoanaerobaculia bacterium]|nr:ABC transporter ATP-binding protein [Thermoanaerobaculia bacterium]
MAEASVTIEHLSKRYKIGAARQDYATLRERIAGAFRRDEERVKETTLWALRDVSFEIAQGEAIGIIGHNGAGKSTLLKILSRITEPTEGQAILRGRVASLLEVGTGFHPELTGRENIYLNGAILGMTRSEIRRNFDAIVAFSEVERFLDTPVKRYSSGMFVRLAFAVAAHLTPEILIVDEVLAVGDIEFQRRCLGRMNEVARSGRTVMFVSHNLPSIESLCPRSVLLSGGRVARDGPTKEVLASYLAQGTGTAAIDVRTLIHHGNGRARITAVYVLEIDSETPLDVLEFRKAFRVRIEYEADENIPDASFGFGLVTRSAQRVFITESYELGKTYDLQPGRGAIDCIIRAPNVLPGAYAFELWISDVPGVSAADHVPMAGAIEITVSGEEPNLALLTSGMRGFVQVPGDWSQIVEMPM